MFKIEDPSTGKSLELTRHDYLQALHIALVYENYDCYIEGKLVSHEDFISICDEEWYNKKNETPRQITISRAAGGFNVTNNGRSVVWVRR